MNDANICIEDLPEDIQIVVMVVLDQMKYYIPNLFYYKGGSVNVIYSFHEFYSIWFHGIIGKETEDYINNSFIDRKIKIINHDISTKYIYTCLYIYK